jgi:hypothetical protein
LQKGRSPYSPSAPVLTSKYESNLKETKGRTRSSVQAGGESQCHMALRTLPNCPIPRRRGERACVASRKTSSSHLNSSLVISGSVVRSLIYNREVVISRFEPFGSHDFLLHNDDSMSAPFKSYGYNGAGTSCR